MARDQHDRLLEVDDELVKNLRLLMEIRDGHALSSLLIDLHEADIAELLRYLEEDERHYVLGLLSDEVVGEVVLHLPEEQRGDYLSVLAPEKITDIVEELSTDDAADIVSELDEDVAEEVLQNLQRTDREATEDIRDLLRYDENTAGGRMTTDYVAVTQTTTVAGGIEAIREFVGEEELDVYVLYVVDDQDRLVGYIRLQDLVLRPPTLPVSAIMITDMVSVPPDEDQELVAQVMQKYDLIAVPVIDDGGRLLGIVTFDDIADIIEDETSEDMLYLAGVTDDDSLSTSPFRSLRRRIPWLTINLGTAFMASMVVVYFTSTIERVPQLAALLPIVAGMGGNAAIQSITVVVRALALGDIASGRERRAILREGAIGLMNGLAMGALAGCVVWWMYGSPIYGGLIAMAMFGNMLIAALAGAAIPIILRRYNFDPALSSGPIVTTFTDMTGFFVLLGLATLSLALILP